MHLTSLVVEASRNLAAVQLEPGPRFNVFHGDNGQGKTNLIETVYVLATLRSFRTTRLGDLVARGAARTRLGARVVKQGLERRYQVVIEDHRRHVTLDGKTPRPLARYFGDFNVVLFAPEDLGVARGAPSERRRFLDRAVFARQPAYLETAQAYEKVLKSRNAVLRAVGEGDRKAAELLPVYDQQLAPLAVAITAARRSLLDELRPRFAASFEAITRTGLAVDAEHVTAPELAANDAAAVLEGLVRDRGKDLARGATSLGPHRDDLVFRVAGQEAASYASQGQMRAMVLAWKTAEMDLLREAHDDPPLLLLDDVSSELDQTRNTYLFEHLASRDLQCFITTTHPKHVQITENRVDHEVRNGVISPVKPPG